MMRRRDFLRSMLGAMLATPVQSFGVPPGTQASPATHAPLNTLWAAYKRRFVQADGRVIEHSQGGVRSHSEGQSYALFHSLVHGDQPTFERVLSWTVDNLCSGDCTRRLPAWLWGLAPGGHWGVIDANNATDADLLMIYVLREASRLWGHTSYRAQAEALATRLAAECTARVPTFGRVLLPGKHGFTPAGGWRLNPSYQILPALRALAAGNQGGVWESVLTGANRLLTLAASSDGYAPDWLHLDGQGRIVRQRESIGGYDAIRIYFWLAVTPGTNTLLQHYGGMRTLARRPVLPEKVNTQSGDAWGTAPPGFSAALLPYLRALGDMASHRRHRAIVLKALRNDLELTRLPYYDLNLVLFGLGADSGCFGFNHDGSLWLGQRG